MRKKNKIKIIVNGKQITLNVKFSIKNLIDKLKMPISKIAIELNREIVNKKNINKIFEFVGPICESTDRFLTTNKFQNLKEGDVLLICDVGAYGLSLGSNYNVRPLPAEILIKNSKILTIKNRQKLSEII